MTFLEAKKKNISLFSCIPNYLFSLAFFFYLIFLFFFFKYQAARHQDLEITVKLSRIRENGYVGLIYKSKTRIIQKKKKQNQEVKLLTKC